MANQQNDKYFKLKNILAQVAGVLIIIPLTPFICRFVPPLFIGTVNLDLAIAFLLAIILVRVFLWLLQPLVVPAFVMVTAFLLYNQSQGKYGVAEVFVDYKTMAYTNWKVQDKKQASFLKIDGNLFEGEADRVSRAVKSKVNYRDSIVRNFSVQHALDNFKNYQIKYGALTRYFSLFKYINHNFNYVSDAQRDEYYASPMETIRNGLGGDCDDHSILMASCMMSIGAKCRLVIIQGHMYPELYVGTKKDFDVLQQAILQMFNDEKISNIYYHETKGDYWVNLDYTAPHPGGAYMNDKLFLIIDL